MPRDGGAPRGRKGGAFVTTKTTERDHPQRVLSDVMDRIPRLTESERRFFQRRLSRALLRETIEVAEMFGKKEA